MAGETTRIYKKDGGNTQVVADGGVINIESGGALQLGGVDVTAALSIAAIGASGAEVVAATNVIAATESGKTFFLNHATEFVSTLPLPALGLRFRFVVAAAPSSASYTVVTNGSANIIKGHVVSSDLDAGGDADSETSGGDTLTFVDGKAVAGDWADFECDGTNWFVRASCKTFDAITITTAS